MKELILITGTGKSGTTIAAKAFFDSGVPMGTLEELSTFAGGGGNLKGVWEHQEAMNLNKAILAANGLEWYQKPQVPLELPSNLAERLQLFVDLHSERICLKDPRFTWTLELWARYYQRVRLIVCFRSPLGFVQSATHVMPDLFEAQPAGTGLQAWSEMNRQLLEYATRYETHFFSFDDAPCRLKASLQALLEHFGHSLNEVAFDAFYVPEARHFSNTSILTHGGELPPEVARLWQELTSRAFSPRLSFAELVAQPASEHGQELSRIQRRESAVERYYQAEYRALESRLQQALAEIAFQKSQYAILEQTLQRVQERETQYHLVVNQLSAQVGELTHLDRSWIRRLIAWRAQFQPQGSLYEWAKRRFFQARRLWRYFKTLKSSAAPKS